MKKIICGEKVSLGLLSTTEYPYFFQNNPYKEKTITLGKGLDMDKTQKVNEFLISRFFQGFHRRIGVVSHVEFHGGIHHPFIDQGRVSSVR